MSGRDPVILGGIHFWPIEQWVGTSEADHMRACPRLLDGRFSFLLKGDSDGDGNVKSKGGKTIFG